MGWSAAWKATPGETAQREKTLILTDPWTVALPEMGWSGFPPFSPAAQPASTKTPAPFLSAERLVIRAVEPTVPAEVRGGPKVGVAAVVEVERRSRHFRLPLANDCGFISPGGNGGR
jgi:hypothetical protein